MNTVEKVKAAQDQREATLEIAHALDTILAKLATAPVADAWGSGDWNPDPPDKAAGHVELTGEFVDGKAQGIIPDMKPAPVLKIEHDANGDVVLNLVPPSAELRTQREAFAKEALNLGIAWKELPAEQAIKAYGTGGPIWLYHTDPDMKKAYSRDVKAAMLSDIETTYPREAKEIANDIMKMDSDAPSFSND